MKYPSLIIRIIMSFANYDLFRQGFFERKLKLGEWFPDFRIFLGVKAQRHENLEYCLKHIKNWNIRAVSGNGI